MTKKEKAHINALLREIVVLRDKEQCLHCRSTQRLQMSHIYPKGTYRKLEFEPNNLKILCYRCHLHWWHKNPIEAHEWLQTALSAERLNWLKMRAQYIDKTPIKYSILKLFLEEEKKKYDT